MAAIKEMGFTPDPIARSMVTNKTGTIGLIVGDIANPFYAVTAKIIIGDARTKGYDVILSDTNDDSDNHFHRFILQTIFYYELDL
jgi:LacI family transcriptional regulator